MADADVAKASSRAKDIRDWTQLFVVVFVAMSGAYQFVYKDIITPSRQPTALELTTSIEKVGKKNGMLLIRARVTAVNPTSRRIYVPAFWFNVVGVKMSGTAVATVEHSESNDERPNGLLTSYLPTRSVELVAQRILIDGGNAWWDPKDKTQNEAEFAIPDGKFDFLEMRTWYLLTRYVDDLDDKPTWYQDDDGLWSAAFKLKEGRMGNPDIDRWQQRTGSGINWAETTLPLW